MSAKEYKEIRDRYFDAEGYVEWDEEAIRYAMKENVFCGGAALKLTGCRNDVGRGGTIGNFADAYA